MAGGNVKYTFQVDANTAQAKKALDELRRSMDQLANAQAGKSFFDENINKAVESAKELKYHLNQAMDAKTGQLNLNAFNKSLKEAGQSSAQLMQNLLNGGAQGQQTFVALAGAIAQADVPIRRMNQGLRDFGTTLKNTVKWELSSGLVHGLVSGISGAVSYAKNLNSSLTDIRIVTGKSVEDMTRFAEQANKAAKSLSTTTKAYTDASLIYYQQGDDEESVKKKTEITLKAANASVKTSAAEMSEYLTAVWNSYQVGADELERYVDIMAALGAKTATSLEEIATSMQKVAATGNTVGVSMEQVSSIIATVSSVTRESAESIGTSYKTIFARMGDLKLGAKDEDGIGLGQVSKSLESIGVEVLDASGDLREMGDIITDLGDKWQNMSNAEKTAIAQVVAGKRQYTQLMALFENWDMYQQNMSIAQDSDGSLQKMQDIQAQSWEAAANRQKAAMESIYSQVINDQAMIKFTDGITGAIEGISGLIDAFGGLGGVVTKFGSIATAVFQKSLAKGIDSAVTSITTFFSQFQGKNVKEIFGMFKGNQIKNREQIEFDRYNQQFTNDLNKMQFKEGSSQATAVNNARELMSLKQQLINSEHKLSDAQKQRALSSIGELSQEQNKLVQMVQEYEQLDAQLKKIQKSQENSFFAANRRTYEQIQGEPLTKVQAIDKLNEHLSNDGTAFAGLIQNNNNRYFNRGYDGQNFNAAGLYEGMQNAASDYQSLEVAEANINQIADSTMSATAKTKEYADAIKELKGLLSGDIDGNSFEGMEQDVEQLSNKIKELKREAREMTDAWRNMANTNLKGESGRAAVEALDNISEGAEKKANAAFAALGQKSMIQRAREGIKNLLDTQSESYKKFSKNAAQVVGSTMAMADGFLSAERMVQTFGDETATAGQKIMTLSSGLSSLMSGFMSGGPIGLALTAVTMLISGIVAHVQQMKKEFQEAQQLKFDELTSDLETKNAEMETNAGLIQSYNSLYETYVSTGEGQDALAESARALAEAYGLVGANVLIASGNFKAFNDLLLNNMGFTELEKFYDKAEYDLFEGFISGDQDKKSKYAIAKSEMYGDGRFNWDSAVHSDGAIVSMDGTNPFYDYEKKDLRDWGIDLHQKVLTQNKNNINIQDYRFAFDASKTEGIYQALLTYYGNNFEAANNSFIKFLENMQFGEDYLQDADFMAQLQEGKLTAEGAMFSAMGGSDAQKLYSTWNEADGFATWVEQFNIDAEQYGADMYDKYAEQAQQFNYRDFFQEDGSFIAGTTGEEFYNQWKELGEQLTLIRKQKETVKTLMENKEGSAEYEILAEQLNYYENLELLYAGVYESEDNADVVDYVKQIDNIKEQKQKITILKKHLAEFMGQSEGTLDFFSTEKNGFVQRIQSVEDTIGAMADTYEELQPYLEKNEDGSYKRDEQGNLVVIEKYRDAYEKTKSALAADWIETYTAFDDYLYIYEDIIGIFGDNSNKVFELVQQEGIKKASQITAALIAAMQEAIDKGIALDQDAMVQQILETNKKRETYDSNMQKSDIVSNAASRMSEDMTMEDASAIAALWQDDKIKDDLIAWEDFVIMDYDARLEYLQSVADTYEQTALATASQVAELSAANYTAWEEGLGNRTKEDLEASQAYFDDFYSYLQTNEATKGWTWDAQNQVFMDGENVISSSQLGQMRRQYRDETGASPKAWNSILSDMRTLATGDALEDQMNTDLTNANAIALLGDNVETNAERMQRYSESISVLNSELSNFTKTGKLSASAMAAFQKVGIQPSDIKTTEDYTKALSGLTEAQLKQQRAEYVTKYGRYDGEKVWTDEQIKNHEAQYNAWLAVKNLQIESANLSQTIFENTITNGEAQISAMEARVSKLKEDAEKTRESAEILANAIETGELSQVQRTTLAAQDFDLTTWDGAATAIERANIAAKQYSEYAVVIANANKESEEFYSQASSFQLDREWYHNQNYGDSAVFDKVINNFMKYRDMSEETAAAWKQAYATMAEQTDNFAGMNNLQIFESVRGELERLGKEAGNAGQIAAAARDSINAIFNGMANEHRTKAQEAADAWKDAFDQIAAARQKLISGESLIEDIAGNPELLMQYLQAYRRSTDNKNASALDLYSAISSGTLDPNNLVFQTFDINKQKAAYGLDATALEGQAFGSTSARWDRAALMNLHPIVKGQSWDQYWDQIEQIQIEHYKNMLMAQDDGLSEEDALAQAREIESGKGDYSKIQMAAQDLIQSFEVANLALQENTTYQEALNTYNQEKANQQEIIDESQSYSDITGSILELSPEERTAGAIANILSNAGIATDDYLNSMQQKGLQVDNLHDVASLSDQSLTNYKHSLAQDAIAAGETIKSAAVSFKAIVTGQEEGQLGYGEESAEGQTATAAVEEATDIHQGLMDSSYAEAYNLQQNQFNTSLTGAEDQLGSLVSLESVTQGTTEWAQGIDDLSNAYAGLEGAQEIIDQLNEGTIDLNEANDQLTDVTLKSVDAVYDYNEAQWDQYKQTLRNNNVTIDGYENLEEYFDEIESGRKTVKKWTAESKKLNKTLKTQGKDLDKNKDGLLDYGEAADEVQAAWQDLFDKGLIDQKTFEDGKRIMSKGVQDILAEAERIAAANPEYDFSQGLIEAVQQYSGDSAQALADLGIMMGLNADLCNQLAAENSVVALQNLIVDAQASGSINWGNIPALVAQINAWMAANGIAGKRLVSPTGGGGGGGGGSSGGGGSGGGGGGGGSEKQEKEKKRYQDEIERYHRNESAIKQVENELDKLSAKKDAAYGKKYVDAIEAETAALRREREEQEKLKAEAESYITTDAAKLKAAGAQIGENGVIENYDALMEQWVDEYNAAVDAWNDSDQDEDDEEDFEKAEQLYEDRLQMIEDYEEALDTAADAETRLQEILNEISENTLEGITYTLELELEVNERDLELLEYYREQYEETLEDQDNLFANLMQQANEYETNFASLQDAYNNLMAEYNSGDLQADEYAEGLADLHSQILENLQNLQDVKDEIAEVYANALDLAAEEIENATDALDHMNETMEAYIAIMGLSGRETDYATMQAFYDAQFATNMANIEVQTKMLAGLREQEEYFKNRKEQNSELTELEQEQYDALMEKIRETESAVLDSTQTTLEVLQAGYENTINRIAEELDEFMAGAAGSISHLQEQYAYFQEEQGRYVSTAKELYEVSSLNRDIEDTLAETTSAASKEALKALQEKINKQSELNEMTEYDIEMNQLQYQLLLARIQLEEAQNSKDTVRLTRDDNGNYAYQYTADEDKVSEAMQKYEDTLQKMNDVTTKRTSEIEQQMINSMAEYKEKMQEIAMDTTLSESEKYDRLLELQSQFDAEMAYLQEQAGIANENLLTNQEAIADHYGVNITAITSSTAGNVNQTVQDMIANAQQYSQAMHDALFGPDGVSQSWSDYLAAVTTVQQASGTTVDDMLNNTANVGEVNEDAVQTALDAIEALTGTLEPINQMTEAWDAHQAALQGTIDSYEDLLVHINDLMAALGQTNTNANLDPEGTNTNASTRAAATFDKNQEEGVVDETNVHTGDLMPNEESVAEFLEPSKSSGGGGGGRGKKTPRYGREYFEKVTADSLAATADYTDDLENKIDKISDHYVEAFMKISEDEELTESEKYAQILELQKMFDQEMETVRESHKKQQLEYANLIDESEKMYDLWLNQIDTLTQFSMLNSYHAQGLINEAPVVIDQNVTIEAEFPNVSNTDEIIEAFNELINRAAQFASAKK